MNASWNQKYNLYKWAKEKHMDSIYDELENKDIVNMPMTEWRYKKIRNAMLYNDPSTALKLLQHYPEQTRECIRCGAKIHEDQGYIVGELDYCDICHSDMFER